MDEQAASKPGARPVQRHQAALLALVLLALVNLLNQADRRALVTLFPLIQGEWGLSDAQLGLAVSLFTLARAVTVLPVGWLADRKGILRILQPAVLFWSLLAVISAWMRNFGAFVGLRSGVGALDGANNPLDLAYLGRISPKARRGLYLAVYSAALYIGSGVGVIYAGVIGERFGWRLALAIPGVLGVLLAVGLFSLPKIDSGQAPITPLGKVRDLGWLLNQKLLLIFISGAFGMFASTALVSWLPSYLVRYFDLSLARAGLLTGGLIIPASIVGALLGGQLSDRLGEKNIHLRYRLSFAGLILAMAFGLVGLMLSDLALTMALFFLCALSFTVPVSPMLVLVQAAVPAERLATTQAAFGLVAQVAGAAPATALVGLLSDRVGLHWALTLPFVACGLGGLLIGLAGWHKS
jgi:MFS transporter, Spinster family, sphingosine-1-phosphate transporter